MLSEIRRIFGPTFPKSQKGESLTQDEQRALNVGAILAGTRSEVCDCLATAKTSNIRKKLLNDWWGVTSPETAVETLERLKNQGHRERFGIILNNASEILDKIAKNELIRQDFIQIYQRAELGLIDERISENYPREVELFDKHFHILDEYYNEPEEEKRSQLFEQHISLFDDGETFSNCMGIYCTIIGKYEEFTTHTYNLLKNLEEIHKQGLIAACEDLERINPAAWDMGRMVNVARWCYDCRYISKEQAWEYIFSAHKECALLYADWEEFGKAYVIGRALWNADGMLDVHIDMYKKLLIDPKSPWRLVTLKNNV